MSCLSYFRDEGPAVIAANPIFFTSELDIRPGAKLTFEVLEPDASTLLRIVGKPQLFAMAEHPVFHGRVITLERCRSTALALGLMRDRPTFCGVIAIESVGIPAEKN